MDGSHIVLIAPDLDRDVRTKGQQIAGLYELLKGGQRYLEDKNLGQDYTGAVISYIPKARRGYLEPAPIAKVAMLHVRVDPGYATIIGLWLPERSMGFGIPPCPDQDTLPRVGDDQD